MPVVNPGIRRQVAGAITRLFNSAAFALPLTHTAVPTRGSIVPTFTRATTKTWQNNDGYLVTGLAGEIGFPGARRVRNLLSATSAMSALPWAQAVTGASTVIATAGQSDPWGGTLATKLVFSASGAGEVIAWRQAISVTQANQHTSSIRIRADAPVTMYLRRGASSAFGALAVTTEWQDLEVLVGTAASTTLNFDLTTKADAFTGTAAAVTVYVVGAQLEDVTAQTTQTAGEYVSVGALDYRSDLDPLYLSLPGTAGHYASTPSVTANQISGNKTIVCNGLLLASVAPAAYKSLVSTFDATAALGYSLFQDQGASGKLVYFHRIGALTYSALSSVTLASAGITTVSRVDLAVTHDIAGTVKFWWRLTGGAAWAQLGVDVATQAGATTGLTSPLSVLGVELVPGSYNNGALVERVRLYSGVVTDLDAGAGGTLAVDFNPHRDATTPTGTIPSSTTGEVWTLNGASSVIRNAAYHGSMVDGVKCFDTDLSGNPIPAATLKKYKPELAATNVLFKSNTLNDGTWTTSGTPTPTQDATGVDGATSAWTLTDNNAAATELILQNKTLTAATWTGSVFVNKTSGAQASYPIFSVQTGSSTTGLAQVTIDTTNGIATPWTAYTGWTGVSCTAVCENYSATKWRVSVTFTGTAAAWYFVLIPAGTTNATQSTGIYDVTAQGSAVFERAQLELGSAATSYIDNPNAAASVTRNADVLTYSGGDIPNLKTLCATFRRESGVSVTGVPIALTDGTTSNYADVYVSTNNTTFVFDGASSGVSRWSQNASNAYTPGTTSKAAWSMATNDIKMAKDGVAQTPDTVATIPTVTQLNVGHIAGFFHLNGNVGGIYGWTRNLSQSELNAVTA